MTVLLALAGWGLGCGMSGAEDSTSTDPAAVAVEAPSDQAPDAVAAQALRAQGLQGLERALEMYDAADRSDDAPGWERFVDAVGAARDTSTARLFWETDLERAKAQAKERGLPILSLRMLGDLRDELSCANSRFFRTALYADPAVSRALREDFVLHWSSERPVPVVEITFGDGRAIKTTTTGNSIHYLLDADGMVLDAAPGLYSPGGFAKVLGEMKALASESDGEGFGVHHSQAEAAGEDQLLTWLLMHSPSIEAEAVSSDTGKRVLALDAQERTAMKAIVEVPMLNALGAGKSPPVPLEQALDQVFTKVAELGTIAVSLSEPSKALMRRDRPRTPDESSAEYEARLTTMLQRFESSIAIDELKNEYDLRIELHQWLADETTDRSFEVFNERVYRELFLTPASDPWLGLVDDTAYDGLIEAGISRLPG